jgi:hypothetical protein
MPRFAIYAQTYIERRPITHGGEPGKRLDRYHLVDLDVTDECSICGLNVDRDYHRPPLQRWEVFRDLRCVECETKAGDAAREQVEREQAVSRKREQNHWRPLA